MSSLSPFSTSNILPPTIPHTGPSLSSESEDEGERNNPASVVERSTNVAHDPVSTHSGKSFFI